MAPMTLTPDRRTTLLRCLRPGLTLALGASPKRMNELRGTASCSMLHATGAGHRGFAECTQACPAWPGTTTSTDESLSYPPNCAQGSRWTASGITWLAPTSASSADATVTVHRIVRVIHQQHRPVEAHPVAYAGAGQQVP